MREMRTATSPQFDPAALAAGRRLPVESAVPGTTLAPIPLRAFASGGVLYGADVLLSSPDTPLNLCALKP